MPVRGVIDFFFLGHPGLTDYDAKKKLLVSAPSLIILRSGAKVEIKMHIPNTECINPATPMTQLASLPRTSCSLSMDPVPNWRVPP